MKIKLQLIALFFLVAGFNQSGFAQVSLKDLLAYPYPNQLCTSPATGSVAWVFNVEGKRNIFISHDKGKTYQQLTDYKRDDGQALSRLQFSPDGKYLIYMRGGEPGGNWSKSTSVNALSSPGGAQFQLWSLNIADKKTKLLASGQQSDAPVISPDSRTVAYINKGNVWVVPIDGAEKGKRLFTMRGTAGTPRWSPDGKKMAFVSKRDGYSFIGIYTNKSTPLKWIDPSFASDVNPVWSPTGDSLVFIRQEARGGEPDSILTRSIRPWEIRIAAIKGNGSYKVWESPNTLNGSVPTTHGRFNLHWAANDRIVYLSTEDNWSHLYSVSAKGGKPLLLTPGNYMAEYINLSPDKSKLVFSANTGPDKLDIDRRHIGLVSVDKQDMKILTPGEGIEALPDFINNQDIALISSTIYRPALPAVLSAGEKSIRLIGENLIASYYVGKNQVIPRQVIFKAADGTPIHGQVFEKPGGASKKPAILAIHGGPKRQLLLGWSYSDYYAAHYAVNQWLANRGYVVLSVNYRLGIGYGNDFLLPPNAGAHGASEYQDIVAAGEWLASQPNVDSKKIGVYGGSYGGYLTALALGKNSDLFAAGVDIHGVHSRVPSAPHVSKPEPAPDAALADSVIWQSSPIAHVDTWKSPVLLIHGDDDRNVGFGHSINLFNRLKKRGVDVETLIIPDDTHHWMRHTNLVSVYEATVDYFERKLKNKK